MTDIWTALHGLSQASGTRERMAARQQCERDGHRYRVHGKANPSKLECSRCEVTWAVGARTEPAS